MSALGRGCVKTLLTAFSAQQKIERAAFANLSCVKGVPLKSILRESDVQNRFHTASVISDQAIQRQFRPLSAVTPIADKRGRGWIVRFVPVGTLRHFPSSAYHRSPRAAAGEVAILTRVDARDSASSVSSISWRMIVATDRDFFDAAGRLTRPEHTLMLTASLCRRDDLAPQSIALATRLFAFTAPLI